MKDIINTIARAYPIIIVAWVFLHFIGTRSVDSAYLWVWLILMSLSNGVIKHILKSQYGKKVPFLGDGDRPAGAENCGVISNTGKATTYGMPSGHSQIAAFYSCYSILYLIDMPIEDNMKILFSSLFVILAGWIMYSRVYLNCHTYQQVIIGGLLGMMFGFIAYSLKTDLLNTIYYKK
tara:strand:- start:142 stop:675 length:534 start_codon:yes stop_codon:yes gene_type:complete